MKTQVNFPAFIDAFRSMDRYDQFGYDALKALFNYLEQLEEDTGQEIELDVIALCCDYSVMTLEEINEQYGSDNESWEDIEDAMEFLENETIVIPVDDNSVIVQEF